MLLQNITWDFWDTAKVRGYLLCGFPARIWASVCSDCKPEFLPNRGPAPAEVSWLLSLITTGGDCIPQFQAVAMLCLKLSIFWKHISFSVLTCGINITDLADLEVFTASVGLGWTWKPCSRSHIPYRCLPRVPVCVLCRCK